MTYGASERKSYGRMSSRFLRLIALVKYRDLGSGFRSLDRLGTGPEPVEGPVFAEGYKSKTGMTV